MADIDTGGGKKVSTKVDMTPMVDLAFLLVTFFMLTTTFNKPQTMEVNMPEKKNDETMKVAESRTTTLVLAENNKVYYYSGSKEPQVQLTDYSATGLRKVLLNKVKTIKDPIVIIKAKKESKYKNLVDAIDEMAITGIKIYALVDITPEDLELLAKSPY
jgi:biopolymer transport protein ExbD